MNGGAAFDGASNRKLMSTNPKNSKQAQSLASPLSDDLDMTIDTSYINSNEIEEPEVGAVQIIKMLLTGQYTYLTYMILSTTCFFFWLMPNYHKMRSLFSMSGKREHSTLISSSSRPKRSSTHHSSKSHH